MRLVAQYVEQAKLFEFLAASEMDPKSKEQFEEQAKTYYGFAKGRAQQVGVALPTGVSAAGESRARSASEAASTTRSKRCTRARSRLRYGLNAIARVAR
jgi:hypothetical protein